MGSMSEGNFKKWSKNQFKKGKRPTNRKGPERGAEKSSRSSGPKRGAERSSRSSGPKRGAERFSRSSGPERGAGRPSRSRGPERGAGRPVMQGRRDLKEIRKRAFVKVREGIAEKLSSRDALILQSITMIDELDKCINILSERMREWYSFHFPELSNKVKEHKAYLRLISEGARENIPNPELKAIIEKSAGADFNEQDILMVQECARDVLSLYERRENMAKYLKELMETEVRT